ncbi:hypothetical protein JW823_09720 [bacterium]|nr:hypothetical protein [candidate division CSSED10-310 bacterium]
MSPTSPEYIVIRKPAGRTKLSNIALILACTVILCMSYHTIDEPDMGFHLSMGRWIVTHRTIPQTDPLTYSVSDHQYIDMHWLYQVIAWIIWTIGEDHLYILFHSLCIITAFLIAIVNARKRNSDSTAIALLILLGAVASEIRFSVRPEVISWIFIGLFIRILDSYRAHRTTALRLLPLIMLFWVNIQGIYVIGLIILLCYLIDDAFHFRRLCQPLWLTAVVTGLACFLNPYGIKGLLFPLLLSTRLHGENRFASTIGEFLSPWSLNPLDFSTGISFLLCAYFLLAVLVPLLLLLTCRQRTLADWLLTGCFGILAAQALRNIPVYILVTLPLAASAMSDLLNRERSARVHSAMKTVKRVLDWSIVTGSGILILFLINGSWHFLTHRSIRFGSGLASDFLPVKAVDFMVDQNLDGRILNELRFGGYLAWKWDKPVFIDGRLEVMQAELYESYESARRRQSPWTLVEKWKPDIALFGYTVVPGWFQKFLASPDWRLVYLDEHCSIFMRQEYRIDIATLDMSSLGRSVRDDMSGLKPIDTSRRSLTQMKPAGVAQRFRRLFYGLPHYPTLQLNYSRALSMAGLNEEVEIFLLQALEESDGFYLIVWQRLAGFYYRSGNIILLRQCLEAILTEYPNDSNANAMMDILKTNSHPSS